MPPPRPGAAPAQPAPALSHHAVDVGGDWLRLALVSDVHAGGAGFAEAAFKADVAACVAEGRRLSVNGDLIDGILTSDRKRYEPSALHPRLHGVDDVQGETLDWVAELLAPAASAGLLDVVSPGNHEGSVRKHHSSDLTAQAVGRLRRDHPGCGVRLGAYAGTVVYRPADHPRARPFLVFHWHGAGGGSMPAWVGQFGSKATWVEGADLVWFGHLHGLAISRDVRFAPEAPRGGRPTGRLVPRERWLVRTPSYLDGYACRTYASEALYSPTPTGLVRVDVHLPSGASTVTAGGFFPPAPPAPPTRERGKTRGTPRR